MSLPTGEGCTGEPDSGGDMLLCAPSCDVLLGAAGEASLAQAEGPGAEAEGHKRELARQLQHTPLLPQCPESGRIGGDQA